MKNSPALTVIKVLVASCLVAVSCSRLKNDCDSNPRQATTLILFKLKNKNTGNDILPYNGTNLTVPDSIKLKDSRTGNIIPLYIANGAGEAILYGPYTRPGNIVDSLIFYFGTMVPDTLIVHTGLVDGWRGDECPYIKEPGITEVSLRNQVLLQATKDDESFILIK